MEKDGDKRNNNQQGKIVEKKISELTIEKKASD